MRKSKRQSQRKRAAWLSGVTVPLPENHRLGLASSISSPGHLGGKAKVGHLSCCLPTHTSEPCRILWDNDGVLTARLTFLMGIPRVLKAGPKFKFWVRWPWLTVTLSRRPGHPICEKTDCSKCPVGLISEDRMTKATQRQQEGLR